MTETKAPFDFTEEAEALRNGLYLDVDPLDIGRLTAFSIQFVTGRKFVIDPHTREQLLVIAENPSREFGRRLMGSANSVGAIGAHQGSHVVKLLFDENRGSKLCAEVHSFCDDQVERRAVAVREAVRLLLEMKSNPELGYECAGRREEIRSFRTTPNS